MALRKSPTHGWLVGSKINKYVTIAATIIFIIVLIIVFGVRAIIAHNCDDYYKRTVMFPNYWIHVEVGSTDTKCPAPYGR